VAKCGRGDNQNKRKKRGGAGFKKQKVYNIL
jgi:hypothetical protein